MGTDIFPDHDLERYCLGMVVQETELAPPEERLLACPNCVEARNEPPLNFGRQ